jgi:hypothetical protein
MDYGLLYEEECSLYSYGVLQHGVLMPLCISNCLFTIVADGPSGLVRSRTSPVGLPRTLDHSIPVPRHEESSHSLAPALQRED